MSRQVHVDNFLFIQCVCFVFFFGLSVQVVQCLLECMQQKKIPQTVFRNALPAVYIHYWFYCLKEEFLMKLFVCACNKLFKAITHIFAVMCTPQYMYWLSSQALLLKEVFTIHLLAKVNVSLPVHTPHNGLWIVMT